MSEATMTADKTVTNKPAGSADTNTKAMTGGFRVFMRLMGFAGPYKWLMALGILMMAADISFNVAIAWVQQVFIDTINAHDLENLMAIIRISAVVSACVMVIMIVGSWLRWYSISLTERDVSATVYTHINNLSYKSIQSMHSGDLVSRATGDVWQSVGVVGSNAFNMINNMGTCIIAFFYLSKIDLPLAVLVVAVGPVTFAMGRFFDRRIRIISKTIQDKSAKLRGIMQEMFQGIMVVKAFGLQDRFHQNYHKERVEAKDLMKKRTLMEAFMWNSVSTANQILMLVCIYLVSLAAINGRLSIGSVLAFVILMNRVQWPFIGLSTTWGGVQQGLGAADRLFAILDKPVEGGEKDNDYEDLIEALRKHRDGAYNSQSGHDGALNLNDPYNEGSEYAVRIKNVGFTYTDASDSDYLFSDLNIDIRPGEIVALVGPSGSGKTTVAQICCGLHELSGGDVEVFGRSIKKDLDKARSLLAYVPQTPYLFAGTIRENISYGRENASDKEIIEAAKAANAHGFIQRMEKGYDSNVGEHGSSLSGGERQRIAIARAFLKNAPFIILDEATSSLDNESEKLVQESMDRLMRGRTALVIAHRLSTIRNATRIIVVDDGKIVEEGPHDALMEINGLYARLYRIQFEN